MKHTLCLLCLLLAACADKPTTPPNPPAIIPLPNSLSLQSGVFKLKNNITIAVSPEARPAAQFLADRLRNAGADVDFTDDFDDDHLFALRIDTASPLPHEGYRLDVLPNKVLIDAPDPPGIFYAVQSFLQLLPPAIESPNPPSATLWHTPCVTIEDAPRFPYRGLMLDVCRHFLSVERIKKHLDVLARFKINRLHWHLTDDQAWRIEIKKFPDLIRIGGSRMEGEGFEYTGFYTQDEIREVIRYAADRYITVIPEIEMPGHALAAIAAYPYLACNEQPTSPRIVWGVEDTVLCPGKESTFDFLTDVLTEVADLFPSEYIHIGGDECPKDTWKNCPRCQKRIRSEKLNLNDSIPPEHRLQAYFIARIERIVHNLNKKIIGWDEILEGGLPPDATVMSWRGEQGGIDAALQGHNVIMTPGSEGLYIDRYEGQPLVEPLAIGGRSTLDTIYRYDPVPPRLASKAHHILGVQANLWAEYLYSPDLVEYRAYPRTLALAEIAWTATKRKDFDDFLLRLDNAFPRLDALHINYHIPTPEMPLDLPNFIAFTDTISLSFSTSRNLRIVYSRDGSDPNQFSESYMFPIFFDDSDTLKIRALLLHGALGPIRTIVLKKQKLAPPAHTHHALQQGLALKTTPGYFLATDAIPLDALWNDSILSDLKHLAALHPFDWGRSTRNVPPYAAIANGFLFIPKDGVYFFHSDLEQLWIDNQLLVSNQGLPKKFSPNDASIALTKGFHHFEVVFLSHVIGGWPSFWSSSDVRLRYYKDPTFANISPELLFH